MKNKNMKSIETIYKNTRFRSRLEAKWALFFDELGIEWDYECEGFESRGIRYLPDFFLPEIELLFECKPYAPSREDFVKSAIGVEASKRTLVLSWGYPAIPVDDRKFEMVDVVEFLFRGVRELPVSSINMPSMSDRFGMIAIDERAAKTLLGDLSTIHLSKFKIGGLETVKFCRCPVCKKFYIGPEFGDAKYISYEDICPFECDRDDSYDYVVDAATKARNHRFGKIA